MSRISDTSECHLEVHIEQASPIVLQGGFRCAPGELMALVGPSGAGKTSMLRVLAGLMKPQRGTVRVGRSVWCDTDQLLFVPPQRRHVGVVFQNYALMPHLSALENVALSLLHLPRGERLAQAQRWLEHLLLTDEQIGRRPAALSGGQQQRVAVARALARMPQVLLLDEPFSAVDQMSRRGLYALLADLRRDLDIPIVLVTHDLQEASLLADTLVVMDGGHVLQQGAPVRIHHAPRNARVADLVGIQNRFEGTWLGPASTPGYGLLRWKIPATVAQAAPVFEVSDKGKLPLGQAVSWVIPGDGISLFEAPGPGRLAARVNDARSLGDVTLASLILQDFQGATLSLTLSGSQRHTLAIHKQLYVAFEPLLIHVMPLRG